MRYTYDARGMKRLTIYKAEVHQGPTAANIPATIANTPTRNKLLKTKGFAFADSESRSLVTPNNHRLTLPEVRPTAMARIATMVVRASGVYGIPSHFPA